MDTKLFSKYAPTIQSLSKLELSGEGLLKEKLKLASSENIDVYYAPFEYINDKAKVVIVGITPGQTQMINAIKEARKQLDLGASHQQAIIAAKSTAAFSGAMRPNLIALLDSVGINKWLGLVSCVELFGASAQLVQTASVLRNPVFINGVNYNGSPSMTKHPLLREMLISYFGEDIKALPNAVYIPLGDKVADALHFLAKEGLLNKDKILDGLPHPSGANAERIAYFLGKKTKDDLSIKTNPEKIDQARTSIITKVLALN